MAQEGSVVSDIQIDLDICADRIADRYSQLKGLFKKSLECVIYIGDQLNKAKDRLGHGSWLKFVDERLPFSDKTAESYMIISQYFQSSNRKIEDASNLTITAAERKARAWKRGQKSKGAEDEASDDSTTTLQNHQGSGDGELSSVSPAFRASATGGSASNHVMSVDEIDPLYLAEEQYHDLVACFDALVTRYDAALPEAQETFWSYVKDELRRRRLEHRRCQ